MRRNGVTFSGCERGRLIERLCELLVLDALFNILLFPEIQPPAGHVFLKPIEDASRLRFLF